MLHLPLKNMIKSEIRQIASSLGYKAAESKESQDICFIPDGDYVTFIKNETGLSFPEGDFLDADGNVIGKHKGIVNYTVGQRKGLGAFGRPMFVSSINGENNTITLVPSGSEYFGDTVINELNFMKLPEMTSGTINATCRVRYSAKPMPCTVKFDGDVAYVTFESNVRAVTPGQSAVFYDGEDLLFGGIIVSQTIN
jgi:tRNA-specific 2-thiouridylase